MAQQQPVFVTIQQPQVAAVAQPQTGSGGYKAAAGRSTGGIQIACGSVSIIVGIASIFHSWFNVFWPIWGGILYVVTGSLGVPTKNGRSCLIVAYMVMSIISALCACGQLIWDSIGAAIYECHGYYYCQRTAYGLHIAGLLVALVEMVVAIVGSAFCCHGVCCSTNQTSPFVVQYNPQLQQQPGPGQIYPPPQGAPAQYPPQGAPGQYPPQGAPAQYPPQGAPAQYPPQGAPAQYPSQGAPPGYDSAPQDKTNVELEK